MANSWDDLAGWDEYLLYIHVHECICSRLTIYSHMCVVGSSMSVVVACLYYI